MERADVLHDVPVLVSQFSSWSHPQPAQLYQYLSVIGMVWYGLVWGVKPNHTRCLHNNRYGITGKTNNTSKDAKTFKNQVENL
jgi:hypothetical protein